MQLLKKKFDSPFAEMSGIKCDSDQAKVDIHRYEVLLRTGGLHALGKEYALGRIDVTHVEDLLIDIIENSQKLPGKFSWAMWSHILKQIFMNPQKGLGAFLVAEKHYNLGNELFKNMLDKSMSYTCAIWDGVNNLEQAQEKKLRVICEKLDLKPGMKVLDIGCGWGNFARFAAKNYKVSVVGLTVSDQQAEYAKEICKGERVEILLEDYRNFEGSFDRVVSIEMIEAVGKRNLNLYFEKVHDFLNKDGIFLIQAISTESFSLKSHVAVDQYLLWLLEYIFPNGYIPNLPELVQPARRLFVLSNLDNISRNYIHTLNAWRENFLKAWPTLVNEYDEQFKHIWLYYLGGCIAFFKLGLAQVYQISYKKVV